MCVCESIKTRSLDTLMSLSLETGRTERTVSSIGSRFVICFGHTPRRAEPDVPCEEATTQHCRVVDGFG